MACRALGVAAPIRTSEWATASLGLVRLGTDLSDESIPVAVMKATEDAAQRLSGGSLQRPTGSL